MNEKLKYKVAKYGYDVFGNSGVFGARFDKPKKQNLAIPNKNLFYDSK
jgi:hypothetical protein